MTNWNIRKDGIYRLWYHDLSNLQESASHLLQWWFKGRFDCPVVLTFFQILFFQEVNLDVL